MQLKLFGATLTQKYREMHPDRKQHHGNPHRRRNDGHWATLIEKCIRGNTD